MDSDDDFVLPMYHAKDIVEGQQEEEEMDVAAERNMNSFVEQVNELILQHNGGRTPLKREDFTFNMCRSESFWVLAPDHPLVDVLQYYGIFHMDGFQLIQYPTCVYLVYPDKVIQDAVDNLLVWFLERHYKVEGWELMPATAPQNGIHPPPPPAPEVQVVVGEDENPSSKKDK